MKKSSSIPSIGRNNSNKKNPIRRSMLINILLCLLNYQVTHGYTVSNPIFKNRNTFINYGSRSGTLNQLRHQKQYRTSQKPLLASTYDLGIGKNQPLVSTKKKPALKNGGKISNNNINKHDDYNFLHDNIPDADYFIEHESVNQYPSPFENERRIKAAIEKNNVGDDKNNRENDKEETIISANQHHQQNQQQKVDDSGNKKVEKKKMKRTVIRPRPNRISEDFLTIIDTSLQHHHNNNPRSSDNNNNGNNKKANVDVSFLPKAYARKRISTTPMTSLEETKAIKTTPSTSKQPINQEPEKYNLNTVWVEMLIHNEQRQIQLQK